MDEQKRPAALAGANRAGWEARGEAVSNSTNTLGENTTQEARDVAAEGWPMRCNASGMSWPVVCVLTTVCRGGFELWVLECPYCGGDHLHGGGLLSNDPRAVFVVPTRASHCHYGDYYLEPSLEACFGKGASHNREARAAMARLARLGYRTSDRIYKPPRRSLIRLRLRSRPEW